MVRRQPHNHPCALWQTAHKTTESERLMAEARTIMPGGVSSPVRAFKSVGGEPVVFDRVKGSKAYDVDGNEYVDYVGTWGPAIVGHADDRVLDAIKETMDKGTSFGAPCALENELAKMVIDAVPSVEMVRFTNSGTEACMGVLRLMRAHTGREQVWMCGSCTHGPGMWRSRRVGILAYGRRPRLRQVLCRAA